MEAIIVDGLLVLFGLLLGAIPFVMLGVLLSAILHVFIKDTWILRWVPKHPVGAIFTLIGLGFLFPVCECGNVPVARRLIRKGLPPYAVIGFLLAAPVCNPIVIASTIVAFRLSPMIVVWRVILSVVIALVVALIFSRERSQEMLVIPEKTTEHCHHDHHTPKWLHFIQTVGEELREILSVLFWGSALAAFSQLLLPRSFILAVGRGPLLSILAMIGLGFIISICSNVDAFLALSYSASFSEASLLAFMVFGPMIDIKVLVMLSTIFTKKTITWMSILVFLLTVFGCLFLSVFQLL